MPLHELLDRAAKILIADDEKIDRVALMGALNQLGYHNVIEAEDGHEAWAKLSAEQGIGLVLIDWQMPGVDGLELVRRLAGDRRFSDIPVIMVTCRSGLIDMSEARRSGARGYLIKPLNCDALAFELECALCKDG